MFNEVPQTPIFSVKAMMAQVAEHTFVVDEVALEWLVQAPPQHVGMMLSLSGLLLNTMSHTDEQ